MIKKLSLGLLVFLAGAFVWLAIAPPALFRVGANYTAKIICSNLVLANRDPAQVLKLDVQSPGHPLLKIMRYSVDERGDFTVVRTGLLGFIGKGLAFGNKERGCTTVSDPRLLGIAGSAPSFVPPQVNLPEAPWPEGNQVDLVQNKKLNAVLDNETLAGEGMRAIVVAKDGRIVAERYGDGFDAQTPLLGWSMTKTVTGALVGLGIKQDLLSLDMKPDFEGWEDDERSTIQLHHLLAMASDLEWDEGYGGVSDVTRMLYLTPDMAASAASRPIDFNSLEKTGEVFNYSSGTSVLISKMLANAVGDQANSFASKNLFEPLGMASAVMETDATGTPTGSTYMYATPRDWARFGQFLLQRGVWNGRSLLPIGYVDWMREVHPASNGKYGRGQVWTSAKFEREPGTQVSDLPEGTFWASGHDGQSIAVIPEHNLVVLRMGLTPNKFNYKPGLLVQDVIAAMR